jgi:hypothetical protein
MQIAVPVSLDDLVCWEMRSEVRSSPAERPSQYSVYHGGGGSGGGGNGSPRKRFWVGVIVLFVIVVLAAALAKLLR